MTMDDATEFGRELARVTRAAVAAAVEKVRAEMAAEMEATRETHRTHAASAEATIAALTEHAAQMEARLEEVAAREAPAVPTVEEVAEAAAAKLTEVLDAQHAAVKACNESASLALSATTELQSQVNELAAREPEKGDKGDRGDDGTAPTAEEVAAAFDARSEARMAAHMLDLERRGMDKIERAIAQIPRPKDGRDALDLEDFDLRLSDDQRTVTMSLTRGETVIERSVRFPTVLYHGIYSEQREYTAHDAVTFGGSVWIAKHDAPSGKPGQSSDWQLAVKTGRPGRDGRVTQTPAPGTPVKIGGAQ